MTYPIRVAIALVLLARVQRLGGQTALQFHPVASLGVSATTGTFEDHGASVDIGGTAFAGVGVRMSWAGSAFSAKLHAEVTKSTDITYKTSPPCGICNPKGPAVNVLMYGADIERILRWSQSVDVRLGLGLGARQLIRIASGCAGPCQPDPASGARGVVETSVGVDRAVGKSSIGIVAGLRSGKITGSWVHTALVGASASL